MKLTVRLIVSGQASLTKLKLSVVAGLQEKYTNAFLGSGDERTNFALELTCAPC